MGKALKANGKPQDRQRNHGKRSTLTVRQERFALAYVRLGEGVAAYREAFDTEGSGATVARKAWELVHKHEMVRDKIRQLRESLYGSVTAESVIADLEDDRQFAREQGQAGAAVSASKAKAQVAGLIDTGRSDTASTLSALAELVQALDRVGGHRVAPDSGSQSQPDALPVTLDAEPSSE